MSSKQNDTPSRPQKTDSSTAFSATHFGPTHTHTRTHTKVGACTHTLTTTGRLLHSFRRLPTHYAYARLPCKTLKWKLVCCNDYYNYNYNDAVVATASSSFLCNFLRSCQIVLLSSHRPAYLLASTNRQMARHCNVFLGLENLLLLHFLKILFKYVNNCKRFGRRAYVPAI